MIDFIWVATHGTLPASNEMSTNTGHRSTIQCWEITAAAIIEKKAQRECFTRNILTTLRLDSGRNLRKVWRSDISISLTRCNAAGAIPSHKEEPEESVGPRVNRISAAHVKTLPLSLPLRELI